MDKPKVDKSEQSESDYQLDYQLDYQINYNDFWFIYFVNKPKVDDYPLWIISYADKWINQLDYLLL